MKEKSTNKKNIGDELLASILMEQLEKLYTANKATEVAIKRLTEMFNNIPNRRIKIELDDFEQCSAQFIHEIQHATHKIKQPPIIL